MSSGITTGLREPDSHWLYNQVKNIPTSFICEDVCDHPRFKVVVKMKAEKQIFRLLRESNP